MDAMELVIRPSPPYQPYIWMLFAVAVAVWLGSVYLVTHPPLLGSSPFATPSGLVALYGVVMAIPICIVIGFISTRTHSIYLTASHIGHTGFSGRRVEHQRTELARIVLFSEHHGAVSIYNPQGYNIAVIAFESIHGEELFRVTGRWWRLADIHNVATACGVPVEGSWEIVREQQRP